jgi:putative hemolysin
LAQTPKDLLAAQKLRYSIFAQDLGAALEDPEKNPHADPFDAVCDHLLVTDTHTGEVVGTYRLALQAAAEKFGSFCTAAEYDLTPLLNTPNLLELSRSCVAPAYRTLPTMQLLWRGLAEYALGYNISFFFGCASFQGVDLEKFAQPLSYLYYNHLAPAACRPRVHPAHYVDMRLLKQEDVDVRQALRDMPPLIKGYLRIGGFVGDGVFVDHGFNTTDVCVLVKTDLLTKRYADYYNARSTQENRFPT